MFDPNLSVKTVCSGLSQHDQHGFYRQQMISWCWKKNTGKVPASQQRRRAKAQPLSISSSIADRKRGGLGIALHPNFLLNGYVYLYWTESSTGADSTNLATYSSRCRIGLIRYVWNGFKR